MIPPRLTIRHIAVIVADDYRSSLPKLRGTSRSPKDVIPRQVAMYLAYHHLGCSTSEVGRFFDKDHTTVIHAVKNITAKADADDALKDRLKCLGDRINTAEGQILANVWVPPEPKPEALPPVTIVLAPPPATDEPGARRVLDAVRGYMDSRKALREAAFTRGEPGARRRVETEYALLARAWDAFAAGRDRS